MICNEIHADSNVGMHAIIKATNVCNEIQRNTLSRIVHCTLGFSSMIGPHLALSTYWKLDSVSQTLWYTKTIHYARCLQDKYCGNWGHKTVCLILHKNLHHFNPNFKSDDTAKLNFDYIVFSNGPWRYIHSVNYGS